MANKSYLYTTNDLTAIGGAFKKTGLSEYEYDVSFLYGLMVSYDSKIIASKLFDGSLAIVADFEKGKQVVIRYLKMVRALAVDYMYDDFEDFVDNTISFLNSRTDKYVVLELHELYDLTPEEEREAYEEFIETETQDRKAVEEILAQFETGNIAEDEAEDVDYLMALEDEELEGLWKENLSR